MRQNLCHFRTQYQELNCYRAKEHRSKCTTSSLSPFCVHRLYRNGGYLQFQAFEAKVGEDCIEISIFQI